MRTLRLRLASGWVAGISKYGGEAEGLLAAQRQGELGAMGISVRPSALRVEDCHSIKPSIGAWATNEMPKYGV